MIDRVTLREILGRAETSDLVGYITRTDCRLLNVLADTFRVATDDETDECCEAAREELNERIPPGRKSHP